MRRLRDSDRARAQVHADQCPGCAAVIVDPTQSLSGLNPAAAAGVAALALTKHSAPVGRAWTEAAPFRGGAKDVTASAKMEKRQRGTRGTERDVAAQSVCDHFERPGPGICK